MVTPKEWRVTALADGRFRVEDGHRVLVADAVRDGGTSWIWLDGHLFELLPASTSRARAPHDDDALMPQMSAKVIRVLVTAGQTVALGDTLVVLEAMKMEMPVRAPRAGVITAVRCAEGDLVQPGTPVVEM
ncbi:MAG: acetyl-CoA carboxylase biotin carboxyl carrier protein subunit [Acidobacteriota bacterium]